MLPLIQDNLDALITLCRKHRVKRLFVFGSAATGNFDPAKSDLDFLVVFEPQERRGFDDVYFLLLADLQTLYRRDVDLVEAHVPRNPYFIASINRTKQMLYAA